jgi:hypothetical protein
LGLLEKNIKKKNSSLDLKHRYKDGGKKKREIEIKKKRN